MQEIFVGIEARVRMIFLLFPLTVILVYNFALSGDIRHCFCREKVYKFSKSTSLRVKLC